MSPATENRSFLAPFPPGTSKYVMLGVEPGCNDFDLKVAYRRAALLFHPDRHPEEDRPAAEQIFKEITAAYRTLSNAEQRRRYDRALQAGVDYRESGSTESAVSLEAILAEIQAYARIFSPDQLARFDSAIVEVVERNLIDNLGEQIVEVYPLAQPPLNASHEGQFKSGAVVLTNLRVLMPFIYEWQETSGNTTTKYKGLQVLTAVWPLITEVDITVRRRLSTDVLVVLKQADGSVAFKASRHNLTELLLMANLWGVRVVVTEEAPRNQELRAGVLLPWQVLAWLSAGALVITAIAGFFTESGVIGLPIEFVTWASRVGLLQIGFLLASFWTSRGLVRWIAAYTPRSLVEMIRDTVTAEGLATVAKRVP